MILIVRSAGFSILSANIFLMSPLLKRNIFADKIEKPALLTIKIIDE